MKVALGFARMVPESSTIPTPTLFALLSIPNTIIRPHVNSDASACSCEVGPPNMAVVAIFV